MQVRGISRPVLVVLIAVAVVLFAFGAITAVGMITQQTDTHTRTLAAAPRIVADADSCDRVLLLDDTCGVSHVLEVPRDTDVRMVAGTGDLNAEYLEGSADLEAGTGDLHAIGVRGPLRLDAGTGDDKVDVRRDDASPRRLSAHTGTGDVHVERER